MMDLEEFFSRPTIVEFVFKDKVVRHHFKEPDSEIDLEYQRRLSNYRVSNGRSDPTDRALSADIFLYDAACYKVEVQNEDGSFSDFPDFKAKVPPVMKRRALAGFQQRIQVTIGEEKS